MKKCILLFHLIICMIAINSNAASKSIEKNNQTLQEYKSSQLTEPITATVTATDVKCFGGKDGKATVSASGGTAPYSFLWSDSSAQNSNIAVGLNAGLYRVTATDSNGLSTSATVTISEPIKITADVVATPVSCFGANDGTITINNTQNGIPPYQYSISGSVWQSTNIFTGLKAGTYELFASDANNCVTTIAIITITEPEMLQAVVTTTSETFAGAKDGAITISSQKGGSGAYEYSIDGIIWTNSSQFTGIASGNYTIWIRDRNVPVCQIIFSKIIQSAGSLIADVTHTNILCNGGNNGSIIFSNASGAAIIEFSIDNGVSWNKTGVFNGLAAGTYDVMIRDANNTANRISLGKVIITQSTNLLATFSNYSPPLCAGTSGSFTISASGGTPPYTGIGDFILPSGASKAYVVADNNGCISMINISMPNSGNSSSIVITESITEIDFGIQRMGAIDLQVAGGTESYTYKWSNGAVTKDILELKDGGTYTVTVTDSNGCSTTKAFILAIPNYLPIAKAGADQIVYEGVTVTLDGSGSTDANQDKLNYIWTAPTGILLSNSTSSKPSFLAPEVKRDSIITITLVVNDGKVNSSPSNVKIAIQNVIKVGNTTQLELSSIKIYPNPTNGIVRIEGLPANQRNKISLFAIDGRLIKKKSSSSANEMIDISTNTSGTYILLINNQTFQINKE